MCTNLIEPFQMKKEFLQAFIIFPENLNILHFYSYLNQHENFEEAFESGQLYF